MSCMQEYIFFVLFFYFFYLILEEKCSMLSIFEGSKCTLLFKSSFNVFEIIIFNAQQGCIYLIKYSKKINK